MIIKTHDLLDIMNILTEKIKENFKEEIIVDDYDFYWEIPHDDVYSYSQEPNKLTLGQLSDDWMELLRLKEKNDHPISYDLLRLAAILELIKRKSSGKW